MEEITTKKIILASIFLFALIVITAVIQIKTHFNTYIAFAAMLIGTIAAARFLTGHQD